MKKIRIPIFAVLILLLSTTSVSAVKSRTTATAYAALVPLITGVPAIQEAGQIYNGLYLKDNKQYLKAGAFFLNSMIGIGISFSSYSSLQYIGVGMVLGGYIFSIVDANLSPKKYNQQQLKPRLSKVKSAPPQILIGSYNFRF